MEHKFSNESLMMSFGYNPSDFKGALKCPIFQTSTFLFDSAEEGKDFFEIAYGLREQKENEELGSIYSRINNPVIEVLEKRLALWEEAEDCAVFNSGMSAIATTLLEFLKPGDLLAHSALYAGTDYFIERFLSKMGIHSITFNPGQEKFQLEEKIKKMGLEEHLALIYIETPANPTNDLIDISACKKIAEKFASPEKEIYVAVDNTYMGPLWQQPLKHGADFSLYSATKYIGGHSDLIAGACISKKDLMTRIKTLRTYLGNIADPGTGWLLLRSLETLQLRMQQQALNAQQVAFFLVDHPKIEKVYYLGLIPKDTEEFEIYQKQYTSPGAMLSFDIKGGEAEVFRFLNALKLIKLAVSLGSTESLAEHPATMTHVGMQAERKEEMSITEKLVRLSIGVEDANDIIWDIKHALESV